MPESVGDDIQPDHLQVSRMKIGELAERVGLDTPTIRFYEAEGVMPAAPRSSAGYRLYTGDDADRLRFIKQSRALGLGLAEIREIAAARNAGSPPCAYVRRLLDRQIEQTRAHLHDLRALLGELERLQQLALDIPPAPAPDDVCICHAIECSEFDAVKDST